MESKFDFSESSEQPKKPSTSKTSWVAQLRYVRQLLYIARDTDYAATLEAVRADIPFRGVYGLGADLSLFFISFNWT